MPCRILMEAVPDIYIIHQTGEKDYVDAQAAYLSAMFPAEVSPFIDDMPGAFARADLRALPLGRKHRCRDHCRGQAGDLRSPADCSGRPSAPQCGNPGNRRSGAITAAS